MNAVRHSPLRSENETAGLSIALPLPNGSFQDFLIHEAPILADELGRKHPTIKTFSGTGLSDPSSSVYLDITEGGFHAMIISPGTAIFIDPFFKDNLYVYACYRKQDYRKEEHADFSCGTANAETILPSESMSTIDDLRSAGVTLRTYDIAISASGEYTAFHGGSTANALAAITTTLNRVRGIYETELAVSFQLIANNIDIIYTDAATDPYSAPPNYVTNLTEVQNTITSVIGAPNYDIGHLFTTGNGGIATVGCVCDDNNKARGVTGSDLPLGDPYNVDFVAHEIGHQFNARHTFNGTAGSCSGNRTAASAYEPGSGSTIMAYTGICGAENVQYNSNAYFHRKSLDEIHLFIVDGNGSTCPGTNATSNNTPSVNADPNAMNNKYIPANTPFELSASGSDPDGDILTYNWEQYDLGTAGPPAANLATGPLFKSFSGRTSNTRTFPKLGNILDGTNGNEGEFLPTVTRTLTFECTARDNRTIGGGFAHNNITLNVSNAASSFAVASHNTSSVVQDNITVNWNVGNTTASPVNCANVDILLSIDGGKTFSPLLSNTPNDGAQLVTLPNSATDIARIKVKCSDNVFFDINNADLRIAPADATCAQKVTNGSFESGYAGWTPYSSNGFGLLGNFPETHQGSVSALFGGAPNEKSSMTQAINVPAAAHFASLTFWHKIENFECGLDSFHVKVNNVVVHTINLCTTGGTTDWEREIVDLMPFKGTTPSVKIELVTNATNDTWAYLDDISLFVCEGGAFPLLPVELIDFQVVAQENTALLTWQTAQESGNAGFEVEIKNEQGAFNKIGFVTGMGTTNSPQSYRFVAPNLKPGIYYFRLRQMDEDGSSNYSDVRSVTMGGKPDISVYPNPVNNLLFFEIRQVKEPAITLSVRNAAGQALYTINHKTDGAALIKIPFDVALLPVGVYFYRLSANNFEEMGRFVVEH